MLFINRVSEIAALEQDYCQPSSSFAVIYGRRRVGKTTLIKQFIQDKPHVYFLADLQPENMQLERLKAQCSLLLQDPLLDKIAFPDWYTFFSYLMPRLAVSNKWVFIFDEFQYLAQVNPAIPSIFQQLWDQQWQHQRCMLILCGSSISMMYATTLKQDSPLYGRRTLQIKLRSLDFKGFCQFFPRLKPRELFPFYCLTGGVPRYIEQLSPQAGLTENLRQFFLNHHSYLYSEPRFLLQEEVRDPTSYYALIQVIAAGNHQLGHIAGQLQVSTNQLTTVLERLRELELVERRVPITESQPHKSKLGLYFIADSFLRFWFRYVWPWQSLLEMGQMEWVIEKYLADQAGFEAPIFEQFCRQHLWQMDWPEPLQLVGSWWNRQQEFDVVGIGQTFHVVGECKWSKRPVGIDVLDGLEKKLAVLPLQTPRILVLFSQAGFTNALQKVSQQREDVRLVEFEQMLGL